MKTAELNAQDEKAEQHKKDEKRRCIERQVQREAGLACDWPGCTFTAVNRPGLVNHQRQSHSSPHACIVAERHSKTSRTVQPQAALQSKASGELRSWI